MRLLLLHLEALFWRYRHHTAKQFRVDLERVVAYERIRAQRDVEETEILARRAALAIIAHRADRGLVARKA